MKGEEAKLCIKEYSCTTSIYIYYTNETSPNPPPDYIIYVLTHTLILKNLFIFIYKD